MTRVANEFLAALVSVDLFTFSSASQGVQHGKPALGKLLCDHGQTLSELAQTKYHVVLLHVSVARVEMENAASKDPGCEPEVPYFFLDLEALSEPGPFLARLGFCVDSRL